MGSHFRAEKFEAQRSILEKEVSDQSEACAPSVPDQPVTDLSWSRASSPNP